MGVNGKESAMGWAERVNARKRAQEQQAMASQIVNQTRVAVDRFGQPLHPGDIVLCRVQDIAFQIVEVTPLLDPRAPTGSARVVLRADVPMTISVMQPVQSLIKLPFRMVDSGPVPEEISPDAVGSIPDDGPAAAPATPGDATEAPGDSDNGDA